MNPGDKVYLLRGREIDAVLFYGEAQAAFQREKWCSVREVDRPSNRLIRVDVERADVFSTDIDARAELLNRRAEQIAEAEAVVAALAAFDPFAVVVVDRTGAK